MQDIQSFDLIVAGGGTAGTLCAIAAARKGLRVAVIERGTCLGGMATSSGLTEMNAAGFHAAPLYHGIVQEILDQLIQDGHGEYHFAVPMSSDPSIQVDRLRYDPEQLKILLEELATACGVTLLYDCAVVAAREAGERCTVTIHAPCAALTLTSRYLVDATGNALLVQRLGAPTFRDAPDHRMVSTLMFRLSNVDVPALMAFVHSEGLRQVVQEGFDAGILKGKILAFTPIPGTRDCSLNVTRSKCDGEDPLDATLAVLAARTQIQPVLDFVRRRVPGLADAYLSSIAPILGVRDARRIVGEYTLTVQDLEEMTLFPDRVACGCYPMDIHDPVTGGVIWKALPGVYHIPYRCLLPKGLQRTLAVGKCLSAERQAFAAVRTMPTMMNLGESAGYAIALAHAQEIPLCDLDHQQLRHCLAQVYHD